DELGGWKAKLFRAACALVEPRPDGRLTPVERVADKLNAALRECGHLSLVVCHPTTPDINHFPSERLGALWPVESLAPLASRLHKADVLAPLFKRVPLQRTEAVWVHQCLIAYVQEHRYREAADLGQRLQQCERAVPVEAGVWMAIARDSAAASRYHGQFID